MKLDGQYPDLMPSHVPWDLLYDTMWSRHETRLQLVLSAGLSTDGMCPAASQLQATLVSVPRDRDPTVDPLRQCEAERGDHVVYPASEACKATANGVLLSRNTSITFTASNWSSEVQRATSRLVSALHLMYPEDVPERLDSSFTLQLETSADGDVAVWATGAEQPGTPHVVPAVSSLVAAVSARPHIGTAAAALGLGHTCTAAGGYVLTFDQASLSLPVGSGWTLLSGYCTDAPTFAVFVRRPDGMEALAARVHMMDDVVEITPGEKSQIAVLVNGEAFNQEVSSILKVRELEGVVRVYHKKLHVAVKLAHGGVTVVVPGATAGYVCGLCGDLNTVPETFYNFRGPDGTSARLDQLVALYTLQ
ncbi:hypothetical protein B566_EDAN013103 [Ephemera danica]|nr:hypothetical protein B566_EDAN013103 [Ephemera danica]